MQCIAMSIDYGLELVMESALTRRWSPHKNFKIFLLSWHVSFYFIIASSLDSILFMVVSPARHTWIRGNKSDILNESLFSNEIFSQKDRNYSTGGRLPCPHHLPCLSKKPLKCGRAITSSSFFIERKIFTQFRRRDCAIITRYICCVCVCI